MHTDKVIEDLKRKVSSGDLSSPEAAFIFSNYTRDLESRLASACRTGIRQLTSLRCSFGESTVGYNEISQAIFELERMADMNCIV